MIVVASWYDNQTITPLQENGTFEFEEEYLELKNDQINKVIAKYENIIGSIEICGDEYEYEYELTFINNYVVGELQQRTVARNFLAEIESVLSR